MSEPSGARRAVVSVARRARGSALAGGARALTWVGFAACVLLLVAAVGVVTWMALRSDAGDRRARAEAERAAELRLALWRADSTVQPLLAREGARPPVQYLITDGSSPLTTGEARGVLLHFDLG